MINIFDKVIVLETGSSCNYNDGLLGLFLGYVAKKTNGAYFIVSVDTHHPLKGTVMIYLENGDAIKCGDTEMKDQHDGFSIGIYNLSLAEVEKMKKSNISSVRVSCIMYSYDMYSFTIKNYYKMESYYGEDLKLTNLTASDITELMKN